MVRVLKEIGNGLVLLFILTLFALGVGTIAFQFPAVQTYTTQKAVRVLSDKLGYPVSVQRINIKWLDAVSLEGVSIRDTDQKPMIDVGRLDVDFDIWGIIENAAREIHLDEVNLYRPEVRLVKTQTGDLNMDNFIARINELTNSGDTTGYVPDQNIPFTIGKATLTDGVFRYDDPREPYDRKPNVFDYYHFELYQLNGQLKDFLVLGDTISFVANDLNTVDRQSALKVYDLDTKFLYCAKKTELGALNAYIGGSYLTDYLSFNYDHPSAFGDFNEEVRMVAHFKNSRIYSDDLGLFHEYLLGLNETWRISGDFDGSVHDFRVRNTDLRFGKDSRLAGEFGFRGLPEFSHTIMDFDLVSSQLDPADLIQYYPETDLHETFGKFGLTAIDGKFQGTKEIFSLKSNVVTEIGNLTTDLVFHIQDRLTSRYRGLLKTADLDLGRLFDRPETLGQLDFAGKVDGMGFTIASAAVNLDADVQRLGFKGYDYRNVQLRGNLQKGYFNGQVGSRDPNLNFVLDGEIDLSQPQNRFDLQGIVTQANLMALGFSKSPFTVATRLDAQVSGNQIDGLVGNARFSDITLTTPKNERRLRLDSLLLTSVQQGDQRTIDVRSDFLTARASGNFILSEAAADLTELLKEYKLYFLGDEVSRRDYYAQKPAVVDPRRYAIDYQLEGRDLTPLLNFLAPDVYISPGSHAEGELRMGSTAFLTLSAQADTVRAGSARFGDARVDVTTSKFVNNAEVLASALITSREQKIGPLAPTEALSAEATWDEDHIHFTGGVRQKNSTNLANINGDIRFLASGLDLHLISSRLVLLDEEWRVNPNNLISVANGKTLFSNLALVNDKQRVSLDGEMVADSTRKLVFEVNRFKLATLNPVLETKLGGILEGKATWYDDQKDNEVNGSFGVDSLSYADYALGNLGGRVEWDDTDEQFAIEAHLDRNLTRVFALNGTYSPEATGDPLNLKALLDNADLKMIEPFSRELVSDVRGKANGRLTVRGTLTAPKVVGEVKVDNGRLKFDYLQSVLSFSDVVTFAPNEISAQSMEVKDEEGNTATVRGSVLHDAAYRDFQLAFNADLRNFKILNTTTKDNDLFYGTAYVTGKASLTGPLDNLSIEASVTSNKGTRMYIPLDGPTEVATQEYIQFVSAKIKEDSLERAGVAKKNTSIGGVKMDFNLNVTPDAYAEIQLDRQSGDIIQAYGKGLLNLKVDTKGDFSMAGNYEIERGDYTFTFQNALNKKFTINPGSRLTWSGDPYGALLDVKATYTQMASLAGILKLPGSGLSNQGDALSRRYPVEVTIALTDRLMAPAIGYNLAVKQYPSSGEYRAAVAAFENRLKSDEQELSRQVSSLILFNQLLSQDDVFQAQTNQGQNFAVNSISELISNQISRWASALNENLEIGVSGLSLDQNAFDNLQLRLSYRFLNDRFRITRDGRFNYGSSQYGTSQVNATSLLGEWTLEYWLAQSGSVRLKAYNRNIQNPLLLNNAITTGGVSMQFTHSFNRFKSLPKPEIKLPVEANEPLVAPIPVPARLTSKLEEAEN